ncbi:MAG: PD-(D/E)XK nuclease family protein [Candidatus Pacearchaeota archaeon]
MARKNLFNIEKYSLPQYKIEEIKQKRIEESGIKIDKTQVDGAKKSKESVEEICEKINAKLDELKEPTLIKNKDVISEISASKLTTYRGCPFAYFLQYVMNLKPRKVPVNIKAGAAMHNVIADFNRGNLSTLEELIDGKEIVKNRKKSKILGWKARWYRQVHSEDIYFDYKEQPYIIFNNGKKILEKFYEKEKDKPRTNLLIEYKFDVKINLKGTTYRFVGVFDKVELNQDKIAIIDYKTGNPVSNITRDLSVQLTIYKLAFNALRDEGIIKVPRSIEPAVILYFLPLFASNKDLEICEKPTGRDDIDVNYLITLIRDFGKSFVPFIASPQFDHCKRCQWELENFCHDILFYNKKEIYNKLMELKLS